MKKKAKNRMDRVRELYQPDWEMIVKRKMKRDKVDKKAAEDYADECIAMHNEEIAHKFS